MVNLESELDNALKELKVSQRNQDSVKSYLGLLKTKHNETYEHSIRVGLLSRDISRYLGLDQKALFYAGLLHDIGKTLVPLELLNKTESFTDEDKEIMKTHPVDSYRLLGGVHEFSAEIALRHHMHQDEGYPIEIPQQRVSFPEEVRNKIELYSELLSLADFYDAITSRDNDVFGDGKISPEEAKKHILEAKPNQRDLIENLYGEGIFRLE